MGNVTLDYINCM